MSCFFIAEAGVNHNGEDDLALKLVDVAAQCGANAIKFQSFKADNLVCAGAEKADYQRRETGDGDQHSMLKKLEMSEDLHHRLFKKCNHVGIEFMSTPFDEESADFLIQLGMKRIKVPSGEITNHPFLKHLAKKDLPMIVSTGMATMKEVVEAVDVIEKIRIEMKFTAPLREKLTILHCTSNYPASCSDVNLLAMTSMANETKLEVGYSDHTLGVSVSTAAVARGAKVIEKHFTLDRDMEGPDHKASLEPNELVNLITQIREVEMALGSPVKQPIPSELPIRELVRKSVTTYKDLKANHVIKREDLVLMRPGHGIQPKDIDTIIGMTLVRDVSKGTTLKISDLKQ